MNVTESNATHELLRWLMGNEQLTDQAVEAAAYLAERAQKTMIAGPSPEAVRAAWPAGLVRTAVPAEANEDDVPDPVAPPALEGQAADRG